MKSSSIIYTTTKIINPDRSQGKVTGSGINRVLFPCNTTATFMFGIFGRKHEKHLNWMLWHFGGMWRELRLTFWGELYVGRSFILCRNKFNWEKFRNNTGCTNLDNSKHVCTTYCIMKWMQRKKLITGKNVLWVERNILNIQ